MGEWTCEAISATIIQIDQVAIFGENGEMLVWMGGRQCQCQQLGK
jgi:hypothetical protein